MDEEMMFEMSAGSLEDLPSVGEMFDLTGKVAVVSGTIGLALSVIYRLASCGAKVVFGARRETVGQMAEERLREMGLDVRFHKLDVSSVESYENMDDLSLSNKTIRGLHTMLRQCLEQAVTERLIPYNPANGCRLPKKEKKKMQIIPPEKIRDYLKAAEEWGVLPMFYLELSTGLRRGELVALLWSDLNLQTKTLTVSKSVSRGKGELVVTEPKTENSVREIYLSDEAIRLLVEDRKNHPFSPYMFPSPKTGGMYGPDCVGRIHKKLLEKAGIEEYVRFHDLRHIFSTLAIQSGIDPKTGAEILGHASAEFSLDVYTHVTAGMKKEAAQKISGFMASVG